MTAFIAESRNALCDARTIKTVDDAKLAAVTIGVTWIGRGWGLWLDRACHFYKNCAFSRIRPMDRVMRCANGGYLKSCERTGNLAFGRSVIDGAIIRPFERGYLRPLITNVPVSAGFSDVQRKGLVGSVLQIQIHT